MPTGRVMVCVLIACGSAFAARVWEGPRGGMVYVLALHPARRAVVYAGTGNGGVFESATGARSWRRLPGMLRRARINALAIDCDGTIYAASARGRLRRSTDGGVTWTIADPDAPPSPVSSLAIDPRTRPGTVYAGTLAGDVRRSSDGGRTWIGGGAGLEGHPVTALAVDRRRRRGVVWAGTPDGLFRTGDGGVHWRKLDAAPVRDLAVDRTRRRTLFAVREGVFRSTDGGATWERLANIHHALSVAVDASTRPGIVYVGTSYTSVLKSRDGGDSWSPAAGGIPPLAEVLELAVDPRTKPSTLYAATSVLGVHRSRDGGATWRWDESAAAR